MADTNIFNYKLNSLRPREKMKYMADDTRQKVMKAFDVQEIYPIGEVYPGWFRENELRTAGKHRGWYSTGEGYKSFHHQVRYTPSQIDDFPSEVHIEYFFNHYLGYVDLGVGKGRPLQKVKRSEDARRDDRYVTEWNPKAGETHRPLFRKEMRHLSRRAGMWLVTWSGRMFYGFVFRGLEGITTNKREDGGLYIENVKAK